jgi:hypothetical protein
MGGHSSNRKKSSNSSGASASSYAPAPAIDFSKQILELEQAKAKLAADAEKNGKQMS